MKIAQLTEQLGGKIAHGNPQLEVKVVGPFESAEKDTLVFAEDEATARAALESLAGAVVLRGLPADVDAGDKAIVEDRQPKLWFSRAAKLLTPQRPARGIHPTAVVPPTAILGANVSIGPFVVIGEDASIGDWTCIDAGAVIGSVCTIGSHCHIYPRVVIYPGVTLCDRVVLHAGVVLGADGFGYVRDNETGRYTQFPQQGTLLIEDDVEIGANSTVDGGALEETRIGRGTKIDNLVHVGHNCDIGEDVILVMGTGISGSSTVGDQAIIAGQVGIGDHVTIGPGVILGGQSGVFNGKTLTNEGHKPGTVFFGTPARPLTQHLREQAVLARLARRKGGE
ncbi:MAG: UDP-3-O-(3-hydroxymyristoyl)glucosamine N-acyltransferase [Terracidiphilus sp.]|nr:UDP-3-O-(3-hydroxymyristoyl)glucosamine N-acyltransferase [Terracidiphilus sp.]